MTTLNNDNVTIAVAIHNLFNANELYDSSLLETYKLNEIRVKYLEELKAMGFKTVQSGKALRYNSEAQPLPTEVSYLIVKSDSESRFLAKNPDATEKQIKERVKKDVQSLSVWLSHGKFLSNVGRDLPKLELDLASTKFEELDYQLKQTEQSKKTTDRIAAESLKQAKAMQEQVLSEQTKLTTLVKPEAIQATQDRIEKIKTAQLKINDEVKINTEAAKKIDKEVIALSNKVQQAKTELAEKQGKVMSKAVKSSVSSAAQVDGTLHHDTGVKDIPFSIDVSKESDFRAKELLSILRTTEDESTLIRLAQLIAGEHGVKWTKN